MILMLLILLLISPALGSIDVAYDAVCNGNCSTDIESDIHDRGQTRITGEGPIAASQAIHWSTVEYNSTSLVDADQGGFVTRMPNVNLRVMAAGLQVSASQLYRTEYFPGAPEVYEDDGGIPWISIENRTLHREAARFKISGNGSLDEDLIVAAAGKSRKLLDAHMAGNFSLDQSLSFSGQELKRSFSLMPEEGRIGEAEEEEIVQRGLQEVAR